VLIDIGILFLLKKLPYSKKEFLR